MLQQAVRVFRTFDELEQIRGYWQTTINYPNADFDVFKTIVLSRATSKGPCVFVFYKEEIPKAILIGRIERSPVEVRLGYHMLLQPKVDLLTLVYGGAGGDISDLASQAFVLEMTKLLKSNAFEAVLFNNLHFNSPLFAAIEKKIPLLCKDHVLNQNPHRSAALPRSLDDFLGKIDRKRRSALRRLSRLFESEFQGQFKVKRFTEGAEVRQLCQDAETIAKGTYQRGIGVGFSHNQETEDRLSQHAGSFRLRGFVLYLKNVPCAFWIGTLHKNTFYLDFTGYESAYRSFQVGTYLFLQLVDDLCKNTSASRLDFGFGDAVYKQRFGDEVWYEVSTMFFAFTPKVIALNLIRQLALLLTRSAYGMLSGPSLQALKTLWRKHVRQNLTPATHEELP